MVLEQQKIAEDVRTFRCRKCKKEVLYTSEQVRTYYHLGYDTKTITCPYCERVTKILDYREQYGFDVNNDERFYIK